MIAFLRSYGWALCTGVLLAWTFPKFHWYPLAWIALVPLLVISAHQRPRVAAAQFFIAGWVFYSLTLQWLYANMFWEGGWAVVGAQGLCMVLASFWAALGALWGGLYARWPDWRVVLVLVGSWVVMEWLQSWLFTGFCWAAIGYSQGPDVWFSQLASLGGVGLLSASLVFVNATIAIAIRSGRQAGKPLIQAASVALVAHGAGFLLYGPDQRLDSGYQVGMYQSNYPQHMKWDPDFQEEMLEMALVQSHAVMSAEPVQLFVWPEALVMDDFRKAQVLEQITSLPEATGAPLFTGAVRREPDRFYNSSVLVRPDGSYDYYDKVHLAPFGEYIPFEEYLSITRKFGAQGGIASGEGSKVLEAGGRRFGPLICFEVLFSPLASRCRAMGADFLVVITNLAWFGNTNVLGQELELARFRAIENRLPLVQCANSGVSAVIDPYGRISVIDGYVGRQGYAVLREPPEPGFAELARRVGALPVPPPGRMLIPGSVDWFGPVVAVLTLAGLIAAAIFWKRRDEATTGA